MVNSVFTESFRLAATRLGGATQLAVFLNTSVAIVDDWLTGASRPPASAFLRVVDFLTSANATDPYARG